MITVDWATKIISVPKADLTLVGGTLYELDTDAFRLRLKDLEDDEQGIPFLDTHRHVTQITIAGVTFSRFVEIINGYTVTFEDGQYAVRLAGSNNNIFDEGVINRNQVSVIPTNSAGLQVVATGTVEPPEAHISAVYDGQVAMTVWLTRNGSPVVATSCSVSWFNPDGTLLFTKADSSPDARGVFDLTQSAILTANTAYYAQVSVTDGTGTVIDIRGVPTGP